MGTLQYMSPEQLHGKEVDARRDPAKLFTAARGSFPAIPRRSIHNRAHSSGGPTYRCKSTRMMRATSSLPPLESFRFDIENDLALVIGVNTPRTLLLSTSPLK